MQIVFSLQAVTDSYIYISARLNCCSKNFYLILLKIMMDADIMLNREIRFGVFEIVNRTGEYNIKKRVERKRTWLEDCIRPIQVW